MEVINVKCKSCGANLKVYENSAKIVCEYCGAHLLLERQQQAGSNDAIDSAYQKVKPYITYVTSVISETGKSLKNSFTPQRPINNDPNNTANPNRRPDKTVKNITIFLIIAAVIVISIFLTIFFIVRNAVRRNLNLSVQPNYVIEMQYKKLPVSKYLI